MSNEDHQLEEMKEAIKQVTLTSELKAHINAQRDVIQIIRSGTEQNKRQSLILQDIIKWATN